MFWSFLFEADFSSVCLSLVFIRLQARVNKTFTLASMMIGSSVLLLGGISIRMKHHINRLCYLFVVELSENSRSVVKIMVGLVHGVLDIKVEI